MMRKAHIVLPDGRQLDYEIRTTAKARSLRLKMTARDGLTVIAPKGLSERQVKELVAGKRDWITARMTQFDEVRHLFGEPNTARPQVFDLPALAESWRVEYLETKGITVGARTDQPGRVIVYGAVADHERCKAALRRWLARRAKESLEPLLESLSSETGLKYTHLNIKSQRTRWGSCSADGVISLNCKLLFLMRDMVRYVLVHELCHILERNHTSRFWTYLRQFEPGTDALHGLMRDAWKRIPIWAHPVVEGRIKEADF
jgi:predicted metal-dependent hydrolase